MLSIVLPSRIKNNPDSNLHRFIESICDTTTPEQREKIEILIKFDNDDDLVPDIYRNPVLDAKGMRVRTFFYERGEGRADINNVISYLGTLVDEKCELIMNAADDFVFDNDTWFNEIEEKYNQSKQQNGGYIIFGEASNHTNYEYESKFHTFQDVTDFDDVINCHTCIVQSSLNKYIGEYCPIFSRKVYNVISGQFWMPSIDGYFIVLSAFLALKYNTNIYNRLHNFYRRTVGSNSDQFRDNLLTGGGSGYNLNEFSGSRSVSNKNFFSLVEQQARNIFLNIKVEAALIQKSLQP